MSPFLKPNSIYNTAVIKDARGTTFSTPMPHLRGTAPTAWLGVWFDHNTREWVVGEYADATCHDQTSWECERTRDRDMAGQYAHRIYVAALIAAASR